jgi:hypothetical protein
MKPWIAIAFSVLLAACATAPPQGGETFFEDALFRPASERIDAADVFAVSPEMREFLDKDIAELVMHKGSQQGLFDAIHDRANSRSSTTPRSRATRRRRFPAAPAIACRSSS